MQDSISNQSFDSISSDKNVEDLENSEPVQTTEQKNFFLLLNVRQWITVVTLSISWLCSAIAFNCVAPFYPKEAAMKGMSQTETGIVFGIFELTVFLTSPIVAKCHYYIGSKKMFVGGLLITGISSVAFGFLNYLPSHLFFSFSLIIRIIESIGDSVFSTASLAIAAKEFPNKITLMVSILETFAGLGWAVGPVFGGFLYQSGGFELPFIVLGAIILFVAVGSFFFIQPDQDEESVENSNGLLVLLRIPLIWIMLFAIVICAISLSFLDPTLANHLVSFNLSPTMVGVMFLFSGGVYTLLAPFWGFLVDRYESPMIIMIFGTGATMISMFLIGPSPFMPFDKSLVIIGISLAILGVAAGALYIPSFQNCLNAAKANGFEDSSHTTATVSGIFQSAYAFGCFIGPTIGSLLVDDIGFDWSSSIIGFLCILHISILCLYLTITGCRKNLNNISV